MSSIFVTLFFVGTVAMRHVTNHTLRFPKLYSFYLNYVSSGVTKRFWRVCRFQFDDKFTIKQLMKDKNTSEGLIGVCPILILDFYLLASGRSWSTVLVSLIHTTTATLRILAPVHLHCYMFIGYTIVRINSRSPSHHNRPYWIHHVLHSEKAVHQY